jgi:energy-converting hydrogenase A subunit M
MKKLPIISEGEKKRILSLHSEVLNEDIAFLKKLKDAFNNLLPGSKKATDDIIDKLSSLLGKDTKSIKDVISKTPELKSKVSIGKVSEKGQKLLDNPTFDEKLSEISDAIDIDENSIIKLMKHESGLDPTIKNSIGCVGLIQFCPGGGSTKTIDGKSYSLEEIRNDLDLQMDAIKQFWLTGYRNGKITEPADLYIYNFFPVAAGKPDDFVLKAKGLSARKVARANPVFNRVLGRPKSTPLTVGDLKRYYRITGMI